MESYIVCEIYEESAYAFMAKGKMFQVSKCIGNLERIPLNLALDG